jgi:hypothetical protein
MVIEQCYICVVNSGEVCDYCGQVLCNDCRAQQCKCACGCRCRCVETRFGVFGCARCAPGYGMELPTVEEYEEYMKYYVPSSYAQPTLFGPAVPAEWHEEN